MGLFDGLFGGSKMQTVDQNRTTQGTRTGMTSAAPFVQPFLEQALTQAGELAQTPQQFYPGQTVAGLDNLTLKGMKRQRQAARDPRLGGLTDAFGQNLQDTLSGQYLDPAFLLQQAQPGINAALSGINAQTNLGGGRGGSLAAQAAGRAGAEALTGVFDRERGRQFQAAQQLPDFMNMLFNRGNVLAGQGSFLQDQAQREIDADRQRFAFGQQEPLARLGNFAGLLGGLAPLAGQQTSGTVDSTMTGTTGQEVETPGALGALGGIAGYALGGPLGGSIGTGVTGLLGGGGGQPIPTSTGMGLGSTQGPFDLYGGSPFGFGGP